MADFSYTFNAQSRRFQNTTTGRFVTFQEVGQAVSQMVDNTKSTFTKISTDLQKGNITVAQWQSQMAQNLKSVHLAAAAAAKGGFAQMKAADYGYVGSLIKKQYQYLNDFSKAINAGEQKLDGSFLRRAEMYPQAARGSYSQVEIRREEKAGTTQARRVLNFDENCVDCKSLAARGWQPIGSLPPIGQGTRCLVNCKCSFDYR